MTPETHARNFGDMKSSSSRTPKPPVGRPPRTDNPQRIVVRLPGELRDWLRRWAAAADRDQGDVIADALRLYRRKSQRGKNERKR